MAPLPRNLKGKKTVIYKPFLEEGKEIYAQEVQQRERTGEKTNTRREY